MHTKWLSKCSSLPIEFQKVIDIQLYVLFLSHFFCAFWASYYKVSFLFVRIDQKLQSNNKNDCFSLPQVKQEIKGSLPRPRLCLAFGTLLPDTLTALGETKAQRSRRADTWKEPAWLHPGFCNASHSRLQPGTSRSAWQEWFTVHFFPESFSHTQLYSFSFFSHLPPPIKISRDYNLYSTRFISQ